MLDNLTPVAPQGNTATPQEEGAEPQAQQEHHSKRQPRDDAKRFAKDGKAPEPQQEQPATPQRFKRVVKRHGKEVEEEVSLEDFWRSRDEVERLRARDKASTERFQRVSQLAQETADARAVAKAVAEGDFSTLAAYYAKNGKQPVDVLADLLEKALAERNMDPREREIAEREAKLAAREAEIAKQQEDAEVQAFYQEVDKLRPQVEQVWHHALQATNLPKTAKMMETTARIFLEAAEAGTKLSPEQVAEYARWELLEVGGALVNELEPTQFFQHFGPLAKKIDESLSAEDFEKLLPGLAKRYHRHLVAKVRGPAPSTRPAPTKQQPAAAKPKDAPRVYDPFTGQGFGTP